MQLENSCPTNSGGLNPLFTVGHSILDFEHLATLLKDFGVELVADVRSVPQSARLPHFSQPAFEPEAERFAFRVKPFALDPG